MKFVQVVMFSADQSPPALVAMEAAWRESTRGRRTNLLEWFLVDRSNPRRKIAINGFESYESAMQNSELAETGILAKEIGDVVDGEFTFVDCDFVDQAADERQALADGLAHALTTGEVLPDVFAPDVFADLNVPEWRFQLQGADSLAAWLAEEVTGATIERVGVVPTYSGFVMELASRAPDEYSRQVFLVETRGGLICEFTMYCTGVWSRETEARQKAEAPMIRPG